MIQIDCCFQWYSRSGTVTPDNRDYCGVTLQKDFDVFIIADGMTSGANAGKLAKELIHSLVLKFKMSSQVPPKSTILGWLKNIQKRIRLTYAADSTSYLIVVCDSEGRIITLHAGDCLLGIVTNDMKIRWKIFPHTLANATNLVEHEALAKDPDRNQLTKSFKGRRFDDPECNHLAVLTDKIFLLASDGFWADLSTQEQKKLLNGEWEPVGMDDDVSFLLVEYGGQGNHSVFTCSDNIFHS